MECSRATRFVIPVYGLTIAALMMMPLAGYLLPEFPYEDVYVWYLLPSGPVVWYLGVVCGNEIGPWLTEWFEIRTASFLAVITIPGLINLLLGGLQWYGVIRLFCWIRARRNKAVPS